MLQDVMPCCIVVVVLAGLEVGLTCSRSVIVLAAFIRMLYDIRPFIDLFTSDGLTQ